MSFVKRSLVVLWSSDCFGGPAQKETWSLIFRGNREKESKRERNRKKKRRWRGSDREPGQTCAVLLGHSSTHGHSARLKSRTLLQKGAVKIFFFFLTFTKIFIYFSSLAPIYLHKSCFTAKILLMTMPCVPSPLVF